MWFLLLVLNILILKLDATCPVGGIQGTHPDDCYMLFITPLDWFSAEEQCITRGGHLASISDGFQNAFVQNQINDLFVNVDDVWLGGNTILVPGIWSWSDNSVFSYTNWAKGQPINDSSVCMTIRPVNGAWFSQSCTGSLKPYVCKVNTTSNPQVSTKSLIMPTCPTLKPCSPCSEGYTYHNMTNKCYRLLPITDFDSAEAQCVKDGGHLASIHTDEENWFLTVFSYSYHNVPGANGAWIGMHFDNGAWRWTDNTPVDYQHWGRSLPGAGFLTCAYIHQHYADSWGDWFGFWDNYYACSYSIPAICKKDPESV